MNNRLKYRIYDTKTNLYLPQDDLVGITCNGKVMLLFNGATQTVDLPDDFIIEQCTGLSDKNGKLIYQGDIVEFDPPCGITETATVEFEENGIDGVYPFNRYHDCGDDCCCKLRDFPEYACKIIGNIHEQNDTEKGQK